MPREWNLLPWPRHVSWRDGSLDPTGLDILNVDRRAIDRLQPALDELLEDARAVGWSLAWCAMPPQSDEAPLTLLVGRVDAPLPEPLSEDQTAEGYQLDLESDGLRLVADTPHGLFDGLQTLRQLVVAGEQGLPLGTIRDWPALAMRGIHLDLKGDMAPVDYWQEAIRRLAYYKVNTVLIEYEDKFPYGSHPEVVGEGALSREALQDLLQTARDHFVEVIPLLQCLGHVEYILRHPQHAALREAGDLTQFCPEDDASAALFAELAEELMDAHRESAYFHLGADEAWRLGSCPRCQAAVADRGRLDLYLRYLNRALEPVRRRGLRPIIWDDMIQRNLESNSLEALPEDVILLDWFYQEQSERAASFYYGGDEGHVRYRWATKEWLSRDPGALSGTVRWLEEAPEPVLEFARRYWQRPDLAALDEGEGLFYGTSLPWVRFFVEQGRQVIGGSAAKGADGFDAFAPHYGRRFNNVATWAQTARRDGALGVISTAWSRYNGLTVPCEPFELGWYTYCASAAFYWEDRPPERDRFDGQFAACFLGLKDPAMPAPVTALEWLDRGTSEGNAYLLDAAAQAFGAHGAATPHGQRFLRHLALAADLAQAQGACDRALDRAWARMPRARRGLLPIHDHDRIMNAIAACHDELAGWRARAAEVLSETLLPADVAEVIETQCEGWANRLDLLQTQLETLEPYKGE